MSSYCLEFDYLLELGQAVQPQEGKYSMLNNTIDIIQHVKLSCQSYLSWQE